MTTTNVFAELLIIGIETIGWIALLIFSAFGYHWLDFSIFNHLAVAVPLAVAAYVLGIIMDRVSDKLLAGADHAIRRRVLDEQTAKAFAPMRLYILAQSPYLSTELDYMRSRLRIMRSSFINFGLLGVTGAAFILSRVVTTTSTRYGAAAATLGAGILLASLSYYAWRASSMTYYLRLQTALSLLPKKDWTNAGEKKPK